MDPNLQILNTSGFPFQLRVADEIKRTPGRLGWKVLAEEHSWQDLHSGNSGFIDIIAGFGIIRFVIECKRGAEATWLFLARKSDPEKVARCRVLSTDKIEAEPNVRLWSDLQVTPDSPEAAYCVVRGQGDKEPMLERLGASLLQSVEALADEELSFRRPRMLPDRRIYVPVVVTAAALKLCRLDPSAVDLDGGKLPSDAVVFEPIPFVRFRKALSGGTRPSEAQEFDAAQQENQRTLFIVQAKALEHMLNSWDIKPAWGEDWPHTVERQRLRLARQTD